MTTTDLFSNRSRPGAPSPKSRKRRLPSWLLPAGITLALAAVFAFAFADRLLPARPVTVTQATLLGDTPAEQPGPTTTATTADDAPQDPAPQPLDYDAPMRFQAAGWFEPDPLPIRATALTDGVVEQVFILEGETVTKGQPLAQLIDEDARLTRDAAKRKLEQTIAEHHMHLATIPALEAEAESVAAQISAASARLSELADKRDRLGSLSGGTVSEQERTAARLAVEAQEATIASLGSDRAAVLARLDAVNTQSKVFDAMIAAAEVDVAEAELALSRTRILSPVDGVVLELKAAPGQKKLLRMDDPDSASIAVLFETGKLQARVDVPLADARGLATGQAAVITSDFLPDTEFKGVVSRIVGTADLQRNTLQAKVRVIDPDPRLRPEMLCRVKFLDSSEPPSGQPPASTGSAVTVMAPAAALIDRDDGSAAAWVVTPDGAHAERRQLWLGRLQRDGYVEVTSGVLAGEPLILPPHDGLQDGRRIEVSQTLP